MDKLKLAFAVISSLLYSGFGFSLERPKVSDQLISEGRKLYTQNCTACHGRGGRGDGPAALTLDPAPPDLTEAKFKQSVFTTLEQGIPNSMMISYKQLPEEARWALVAYVESLNKNASGKK